MRTAAIVAILTLAISAQTQLPTWDAKTTVDAAEVLVLLNGVDLNGVQLRRLREAAVSVRKARERFDERVKGLYEREQARMGEIVKAVLAGDELTPTEKQRITDFHNQQQGFQRELDTAIQAAITSVSQILNEEQTLELAYDDRARQDAREFITRLRNVPENEWNRFADRAAMDLMRNQMSQLVDNPRDRRGGPDTREQMAAAREEAMRQLWKLRTMPEDQIDEAVVTVMRQRTSLRGAQERLNDFLRRVVTSPAAPEAIETLIQAKR